MNKRITLIASILCIGIAVVAYVPSASARIASNPNAIVTSVVDRVPGTAPKLTYNLFLPLVVNSAGLPNFSHIYIIIMENKEYSAVIGNASAPYFNSLATAYALATNYTGVTHPSEPNYVALFSGSTQGITDDANYDLPGQNLADQLEPAGKTWKVYAQNYPLNCSLATTATGGPDDPVGTYARKHNPAISFTNISGNSTRCANITDFSHFDPAAANYEMIVPNLCNDTHDCSIATGDNFLKGFVPQILNSNAWKQGGVLFITYDEGSTNIGGGGIVATAVISNYSKNGFTSSISHNHYSLLRTIEDSWGLGCLNYSCSANNLAEFFQ